MSDFRDTPDEPALTDEELRQLCRQIVADARKLLAELDASPGAPGDPLRGVTARQMAEGALAAAQGFLRGDNGTDDDDH